jgi:hypothetical protein
MMLMLYLDPTPTSMPGGLPWKEALLMKLTMDCLELNAPGDMRMLKGLSFMCLPILSVMDKLYTPAFVTEYNEK